MTGRPEDGQPRWLSADEQHVWRDFLAAVGGLRDVMDRQLQAEAGMTHSYYEVLVHLSEAPGHRLRMSDLAEGTRSSRSRLSHAVARLEERGWARRESCAEDRRGQWCQLTDEGYAAIAAAAPGHVEAVRAHVFDVLSPEQVEQLGAIAAAMKAAVSATEGAQRRAAEPA